MADENQECSRLDANFQGDTTVGGFGVVNCLGASLHVSIDTMVVTGAESVEVVQSMEGDGVFWSTVTEGGGVAGHVAFGDIVCGLSTHKETITAENSVSSESRALDSPKLGEKKNRANFLTLKRSRAPRVWTPDCL